MSPGIRRRRAAFSRFGAGRPIWAGGLLSFVLATMLVLGSSAALAARGDPQKELTPADNTRARSMLLRKSDLGPGFRARPATSDESEAYCKALDESDLTVTGEAESPSFERGLVFVTSAAQVYESAADANASWRRGVSAAGERCVRELLRREFARQSILLRSMRRASFPSIASRAVAYRISVSTEAQGVTVALTVDMIVLMHSRAQVALFFTGLTAVPRSEQVALSRVVAQRMTKAMRGA